MSPEEIGLCKPLPQQHVRIQTSILARRERTLLNWLCEHMPSAITPDGLTWIGLFGAAIVFLGYVCSRYNPAFLWLATLGYLINWLGDSLDGSLARYRGLERPRYGYFLDHSADAMAIVLIMVGLGFSGYVRMDAALFALLGYFMLCIYVFLCNHVTGRFQLTFLSLGPTELRIGLVALNVLMYFNCSAKLSIGSETLSSFDVILICDGLLTIFLSVNNMLKVIKELDREDRFQTARLQTMPLQEASVPKIFKTAAE
jgi:phosphatidylglycerophosphate synthase